MAFRFPFFFYVGGLLLIPAVYGMFWLIYNFNNDMDTLEGIDDIEQRNSIFYGRFISMLGAGIIFLSLTNAVILGGFIYNDVLSIPFSGITDKIDKNAGKEGAKPTDESSPATTTDKESTNSGTKTNGALSDPQTTQPERLDAGGHLLLVSMLMAILGSLFFTANTLIAARNEGKSDFSRAKFWSGLWFRMGESVLFVLVFFLLGCSSKSNYNAFINWFPALSLFLGMFVKSGERVVFGLAERLFEMTRGLLPATAPSAQALAPGPPRNLTLAKTGNQTVALAWDEPVLGGPVTSYRIYRAEPAGKTPKLVGETPPGSRTASQPFSLNETACFHITALNNEAESKPSNTVEP
ncbi:MAG: hypothetical protein JEZ11_05460 [Desulfobacterales bacterium]|nr:hypothetical protein [Desulfobacterales bacterium]